MGSNVQKIQKLESAVRELAEKEKQATDALTQKTIELVDVNIDHAKMVGQVKLLLRAYKGGNLDPSATLEAMFDEIIVQNKSVACVISSLSLHEGQQT